MTHTKLLSVLTGGLLYSTLTLAAVLPTRDDSLPTPKQAIAIKLSPSSSSSSSKRALTGADLVSDLVSKALQDVDPSITKRQTGNPGEFDVLPLYNNLDKIAEMVKEAVALDPTYEPADFGAWYQVLFSPETVPSAEDATPPAEILSVLQTLNQNDEVTSAQILGGSGLPRRPQASTINPNDDPQVRNQGYLREAGINVQYAWGFPGGDGTNTTLIDVESGWFLEHEDLIGKGITLKAGVNVRALPGPGGGFFNWPHGTAVLGEIFMQDNQLGGVGVSPKATGHVVSITQPGSGQDSQPQGIMDATSFLKFGDVMLLEMQTGDVNGSNWPVEILDAEFEAIRLAVAKGITVVEPASNGGKNMDQPVIRFGETQPRGFLIKGHRDYRDSGALMVGAASPSVPHTRLSFSNFGGRVDVYSWGERITTTNVDEANNSLYDEFDGTSGASPIVAGAVLSIQGMVSANRRGAKLGPADMKRMIVRGGTASANPTVDKIGVQPNLKALIDGGFLR